MAETLGMALHAINVILILALLYIYLQNYTKMKSKYTIGLMFFAFILLVQSVMGLYFDTTMVMYSTSEATSIATLLEAIKAVSFAILLWISWE